MNISALHNIFLNSSGVNTDTRSITNGEIFFALKGANFNGNKFAMQALNDGATHVVVDENIDSSDDRVILVPDVLAALQELARYHRDSFDIPFIGITGSNGKTTTKELLNAVLSTQFKVHATKGNLNNHIGVPLTLLSMPRETEIAIIEMGANHVGEIAALCNIANPTHGLITNIGKAHLEGFGGVEGIIRGKSELYHHLIQNGGTGFINMNDHVLANMGKRFNHKVEYPHDLEVVGDGSELTLSYGRQEIKTQLTGAYNRDNVGAALEVGKFFNIPDSSAIEAISAYSPTNNRSQIIKQGSNTIVLDAYNANPSSMEAAIANFSRMEGKKTVILGDMFELGDDSPKEHAHLGELVAELAPDLAIFCGIESRRAAEIIPDAVHFETRDDLATYLKSMKISDSNILVKASRGIGLEKIVELL